MLFRSIDLHERGLLADDTVVGTVMANLGLRRAFGACGISFHETAVGDRYVLEALEANGWTLGGEQSGHLIFRHLATTGDGLLAGIQALAAARRRGRTLVRWVFWLRHRPPPGSTPFPYPPLGRARSLPRPHSESLRDDEPRAGAAGRSANADTWFPEPQRLTAK